MKYLVTDIVTIYDISILFCKYLFKIDISIFKLNIVQCEKCKTNIFSRKISAH